MHSERVSSRRAGRTQDDQDGGQVVHESVRYVEVKEKYSFFHDLRFALYLFFQGPLALHIWSLGDSADPAPS